MTKPILILRPMCLTDFEAVMAIEVRAYPFPWTMGNFSDCLQHAYPCFVGEHAGDIVAYVVLMRVLDELHILNLCVDPDYQGKGFGKHLLTLIDAFAEEQALKTCFLEVRPSNISAIKLYLQSGFNEIGLRKGYYPAKIGREDAIVMAKSWLNNEFDFQ